MRFECDSCHAKYKISDEKVRGRVVRFPCRKCDHKIVIDGRQQDADVTVPAGAAYGFEDVTRRSEPVSNFAHEAATARARRPSAPARRRPPSVPPRRPSAASRRLSSIPPAPAGPTSGKHPGLAPPVPMGPASAAVSRPQELPEWHVSINDVPVGPIRLEEMGHKIDAGAVSEYSLVWREGFEEWRPLATVPELMALLHEHRQSGLPSRTSFSSMPPFVETRAAAPEREELAASSSSSASFITGMEDTEIEFTPLADSLQPEGGLPPELSDLSQPPAPIGPEGVFQSSPQLGSFSGLPPAADERVSVPGAPPEPAAATAEPRRGLSIGVLALIVAIAVFSGVIAFLAFERFGDSLLEQWLGAIEPTKSAAPAPRPTQEAEPEPLTWPPAVDEASIEETAEDQTLAEEAVTDEATQDEEVADETEGAEAASDASAQAVEKKEADLLVPPPDPSDERAKIAPAPSRKPKARRKPRPKPAVASSASKTDSATATDQKLLEEYGSGADAAPANIDVKQSGSTQSGKPPLDGDAIRSTVTANKPKLQRCYERAIRGQQSPPSVRLDLSVMVAPSGRVKSVSSQGSGPGGLAECIEASVRRWRFPASAEGGPAKFPIVFSAN